MISGQGRGNGLKREGHHPTGGAGRVARVRIGVQRHPGLFMAGSFVVVFLIYGLVAADTLVGAMIESLFLAVVSLGFVFLYAPGVLSRTRPGSSYGIRVVGICLIVMALVLVWGGGYHREAFQLAPLGWAIPLVMLAAICMATGIFEESLFRVVAFGTLVQGSLQSHVLKRHPVFFGAIVSSLLFGMFHASFAGIGVAAEGNMAWESALKPVQATLFGFVMAAVLAKGRSLRPPATIHALFDMVVFIPGVLTGRGVPVSSFVLVETASASLAFTVALVPLCVAAAVWLHSAEQAFLIRSSKRHDSGPRSFCE